MDIENLEEFEAQFDQLLADFVAWATSPALYAQLGIILIAIVIAFTLAGFLRKHTPIFRDPVTSGPLQSLRNGIHQLRDLLAPLFIILFLAIAVDLSMLLLERAAVVRIAQGLAVVVMIYSLIARFVPNQLLRRIIKWTAVPIAVMQVFGVLDDVVLYLESISFEAGNIKITAYGIVRVLLFGAILFWLGRISNRVGQRIIRQQEDLDIGTREVFAKLFQVTLILFIFILLLQVMGINITALAVFGGALGVGLGFGLQSIASNFISGMIILLDRSLSVGDYIELEDGRHGRIRELNMRSALLETFDGKDIMVPNEQFITTSFVNWTHKNLKQRYSITFQVAYSTDLHKLFPVLREAVAEHPKVLSGPDYPFEEQPDAEICGFGDSGVDILVEFWMEGIDDGENRVGGDLYLMIWDALKANGVEIPFPQREIKILKVGEQPGH